LAYFAATNARWTPNEAAEFCQRRV
jgi:hypothetical protein